MDNRTAAVQTRVEGPLLIVTINRPQARNAVNMAVAQGIAEAMTRLDTSTELRVGVITGAGGNFCAGMDLKAFANGERPWTDGSGFAGMTELPPRKPLIAAVEGFALAGGFEIALACVEPGEALAVACRLAREVAENAPLAVEASKQIVANSHTWPVDEMFARQRVFANPVVNSHDALEGARAFAEKRAPAWQGC